MDTAAAASNDPAYFSMGCGISGTAEVCTEYYVFGKSTTWTAATSTGLATLVAVNVPSGSKNDAARMVAAGGSVLVAVALGMMMTIL